MDKFNLITEREKWVHKWLRRPVTARCIAHLREIDEEFIKSLKEELLIYFKPKERIVIETKINELAGE
jgi:hypothetical protein